jgi:hypothetical protein
VKVDARALKNMTSAVATASPNSVFSARTRIVLEVARKAGRIPLVMFEGAVSKSEVTARRSVLRV